MSEPESQDTLDACRKYKAYAAALDHKTFTGEAMMEFNDMPSYIQAAWANAIHATTGREAFAAYLETTGNRTMNGRPAVTYESLTILRQRAWDAYAACA